MKISCFLLLLILPFKALPQVNVLRGFVTDEDRNPIEYFHAVLLAHDDSSLLVGGAFTDGFFSLEYKPVDKCLLRISSVGYKEYITTIELSVSYELDTIQLEGLTLNEVVVKARLPVFHRSGRKLILSVNSTILEDAGSSMDVLKRAPGVLVDNNDNITIFGKGTPLIFIDNKEVKTAQELDVLQSGSIEKLEIDRTPSARYDASAKAVIRIITKQSKKEKLNAEIYNRAFAGRRFSNSAGITLNNVVSRFTNFISYGFSLARDEHYLDEYENNYQPDYTIYNQSNTIKRPDTDAHNLIIGSQWQIDTSNVISLQYHFSHRDFSSDIITNQSIQKSNEMAELRLINQDQSKMSDLHNISFGYVLKLDSLKRLSISSDFASQNNNGMSEIEEMNLTKNSSLVSLLNNTDDFKVFTAGCEYSFPFSLNGSMIAGGKFSYTQNQGGTELKNLSSNSITYSDLQEITDNISAAHFTMKEKYSHTTLNIGVRGEYTSSNIIANNSTVLDTGYFSFFPFANATYSFSENMEASLSLSRKIARPSFSELNPSITYFDSLSYGQGNPLLKPTYNHNISLEISLPKNISTSLEYNYNKNARIVTASNDKDNSDIVRYSPINIDKAEYIDWCLDYNYSGKAYSFWVNTCVEFPFVNVPFLDSVRKLRNPAWYFTLNNDIALGNMFRLFCNFSYQSKSVELMTEYGSSYDLSAGINAKLLNNKLLLAIEANDIFNTSDTRWIDKYGNIER